MSLSFQLLSLLPSCSLPEREREAASVTRDPIHGKKREAGACGVCSSDSADHTLQADTHADPQRDTQTHGAGLTPSSPITI